MMRFVYTYEEAISESGERMAPRSVLQLRADNGFVIDEVPVTFASQTKWLKAIELLQARRAARTDASLSGAERLRLHQEQRR